jgi:hypothetical protein
MTRLDDEVIARFGPVLDALRDERYETEDLCDALKAGLAVIEARMLGVELLDPQSLAHKAVMLDMFDDGKMRVRHSGESADGFPIHSYHNTFDELYDYAASRRLKPEATP